MAEHLSKKEIKNVLYTIKSSKGRDDVLEDDTTVTLFVNGHLVTYPLWLLEGSNAKDQELAC